MAMQGKDLNKLLEARAKLAALRGFTIEYQNEQEKLENTITHREIAPATHDKYNRAAENWLVGCQI